MDFSEARDLFVNIFEILRPNCKFSDYELILEKPKGLNAKCPKLEFPPWTDGGADQRRRSAAARSPEYGLRPLRCTKAHRRGCKRDRGARRSRLGPHRSSGGGVATGRRGGVKRSREARWGGVPARERRREGLGEVWGASGVVRVAFIGPGEGTGGGGWLE
jgi:hypothetical protein